MFIPLGVITNTQMSERTAGTHHHNNERVWLDTGRSIRDRNDRLLTESIVLCCTGVRRSRKEVGCSQASMLYDVTLTSLTRKQVRGSCFGSTFLTVNNCSTVLCCSVQQRADKRSRSQSVHEHT